MINVHEQLLTAFNSLPLIEGFSPNYKWGNEEHLNVLMKLYYNNPDANPYPIIYNVTNQYSHDAKRNNSTATLSLLLATRNVQKDLINNERWATSYRTVLFPLAQSIQTLFSRSEIFNWNSEYDLFEFPNYSQAANENATIDIWDALRFDTQITINNNCFKPVKY